jgi:hypothetical protein
MMTDAKSPSADDSAIDDVRRIREQFNRESGGDIRRHVAQTLAAYQELQVQLQLRTIAPPEPVPSKV